jgi:hypothetical protein
VHICTDFGGLVRLGKNVVILSSPIRESEMATFARASAAPLSVGLESFSATRTAMTPKSELAVTSLVVIALLAGAAIVSIAAFAKQARYGIADMAMLVTSAGTASADNTMVFNSYNKAEAEVLDRDLYPFCLNAGDDKRPSAPGRRMLGQDDRAYRVSAGSATGAAAKSGRTDAAFMNPRPAADGAPRPRVAFVTGISDLGCGIGNYK